MRHKLKVYAGIGSRRVPQDIMRLQTRIATKLDTLGVVLRSGDAVGSDRAFQEGSNNYISYKKDYYNLVVSGNATKLPYSTWALTTARNIAESIHPAWHLCREYARAMHTRNVFQILGLQLKDPVEFVVCWTPEAEIQESQLSIRTGGTATALRLAFQHGISLYNLAYKPHFEMFSNWVLSPEVELPVIL